MTTVNDYKERVAYDANGNILQYLRNGFGNTKPAMDYLNYHYYAGTNRLSHVTDTVNNNNYKEDIDSQNPGNYEYDEIGNLVADKDTTTSRNIRVKWNVYGKITSIDQDAKAIGDVTGIIYHYDPNGNRAGKNLNKYSAAAEHHWYVRDAQGNVLAVYEHVFGPNWSLGPLKLKEHHVYGSSRLGIVRRDVDVTSILNPKKTPVTEDLIGNTYVYTAERGWKLYELTNHLGNVLVTVTDKKNGVPSSGNSSLIEYYMADVVSASDYYPFGMLMPGRKFESGAYRYGFNGKENDNEVKGEGNRQDYGMRVYDPRLGKFLSVDPLTKDFPWYTPYQFAGNSPIANIDLDGAEPKPAGKNGTAEGDVEKTSERYYHRHGSRDVTAKWFWHEGGLSQGYQYDPSSKKLVEVVSQADWYSEEDYQKILQAGAGGGLAGQYASFAGMLGGASGVNMSEEEKKNFSNTAAGKFIGKATVEGVEQLVKAAQDYANQRKLYVSGLVTSTSFNVEDMLVIGLSVKLAVKALAIEVSKKTSKVLLNTTKQLQAKFKHAGDFGVVGSYSPANGAKFSAALNQHINAPGTQVIQGTYRNANNPVTFYLNPSTGLNVISTRSGQFISGAKLDPKQVKDILTKKFLW